MPEILFSYRHCCGWLVTSLAIMYVLCIYMSYFQGTFVSVEKLRTAIQSNKSHVMRDGKAILSRNHFNANQQNNSADVILYQSNLIH